ncbi:MAG: nucleoside deaminase [Clostridiales bacterium]|nr:nucleoside deaminase [Clostridiales bacterium]
MMRFALEEARIAFAEGEIPVGAVVADGERVLARAHNRRETDADPCAHAEILALRKAAAHLGRWRLQGLTLYVTLEPCPMCAGAAEMSGLARVVYGARDAQYGCCGSVYRLTEDPAFPTYCPADGGVLADECAALVRQFFQNRRVSHEK